MKKTLLHSVAAIASMASLAAPAGAQDKQPYQGTIGKSYADSKEWWPDPVKAPPGAPNIVWILLDDVGFGASSSFGGGINTPTFDALADQGLRYTNFHTTAVCAPTRAALLTGRNSSSVHVAGFSHTVLSAGFPGWDGRIPSEDGTIAEILRDGGYNTFAVGKYGVTPDEDASDAGPFDRWPTGKGFDHFFGFLGSQTDQYKPDLVEDQAHVTPDGRHLNEQITDKAISYIDRQKKAAPNKPFFLYYAPGATHAPHQVAAEWSDKYKAKFDAGWDVYRQTVFAQQKKLGLIPANAVLPDRDPAVKPWKSLSPDEKKLYARFMEVYAGFLEYTDHEVGRLVDHLKQTGQYDNTLFVVMIGDNGASKEGTANGDIDRSLIAKPLTEQENIAYNLGKIDELGTAKSVEGNYPYGWSQSLNTPFREWKADADAEGGSHNPLILAWPKGIKEHGEIRTQYGHVIDILPTTLELTGLKAPEKIRNIEQKPIEGISLAYSIDDPAAESRRKTQYYYIFGSRAIYHDGWKAGLAYPNRFVTGAPGQDQPFDEKNWRLYNLNEDFNERIDLAKKYPEKLAEMKALFDQQAKEHNLYPLITWDDIGKIHRSPGSGTLEEELRKINPNH
ncbi:MAG: arylsulfatase [Candidatus Andeanibacterium colombiense]|uniref:Arylsulfatase n=1 Tax=Candidatus Andeanibacterium colombiense TaxID=3121345 RepID=A0AAJ5X5L0_9SPHN|nr:MAG: arylsulfatase [Sphingomonadaceae bacterium]